MNGNKLSDLRKTFVVIGDQNNINYRDELIWYRGSHRKMYKVTFRLAT